MPGANVDAILTPEAKMHFVEHGYCVLPGLIPELVADRAAAAMHAALFKPDTVAFNKGCNKKRVEFGHLQSSDIMWDLQTKSPLHAVVDYLIGPNMPIKKPHHSFCQVATRPPDALRADMDLSEDLGNHRWHIDGCQGNGTPFAFSMLVGVALSDQSVKNHGNLCVWPGSHRRILPYVKKAFEAKETYFDHGRPNMGAGKQVLMNKGDVVLVHHKVCHQVSHNVSPLIRQQVYFRMSSPSHHRLSKSKVLLDDLWAEFPKIQDVVAAYELRKAGEPATPTASIADEGSSAPDKTSERASTYHVVDGEEISLRDEDVLEEMEKMDDPENPDDLVEDMTTPTGPPADEHDEL
ncbi:hypothetical protein DIPPA_23871 [Diplonema papillatum]|nr:hypothetical protein DIPPA_23871 [Diplonema papillatum]|eukprot:gene21579-33198_t